eukprot:CAMPEP_0180527028 /NCGR_PEP_ID=MMETSP1036_2-20121128/60015_1 /TAXON_ID=632150 /ORGANISM="Azadinium spinosum, Strain 3D9" /LENGTH=89 /DNA_ID=CAMNT_0022540431 /DNA_START=18 /DNA_END=285 /DNA_ORIENTATION=+
MGPSSMAMSDGLPSAVALACNRGLCFRAHASACARPARRLVAGGQENDGDDAETAQNEALQSRVLLLEVTGAAAFVMEAMSCSIQVGRP